MKKSEMIAYLKEFSNKWFENPENKDEDLYCEDLLAALEAKGMKAPGRVVNKPMILENIEKDEAGNPKSNKLDGCFIFLLSEWEPEDV